MARVVGHKKAREIWYLCRQYTAQEALDMGLVNTVVPLERLEEETIQWAKEILEKSPIALRFLNFRDRMLDSLSVNAYSIYLLHYAAVVWLQYALLAVALSAVAKGTIVFALALGSSWAASAGSSSLVVLLPGLSGKGTIADQRR